jgi:hypothetical protein
MMLPSPLHGVKAVLGETSHFVLNMVGEYTFAETADKHVMFCRVHTAMKLRHVILPFV